MHCALEFPPADWSCADDAEGLLFLTPYIEKGDIDRGIYDN